MNIVLSGDGIMCSTVYERASPLIIILVLLHLCCVAAIGNDDVKIEVFRRKSKKPISKEELSNQVHSFANTKFGDYIDRIEISGNISRYQSIELKVACETTTLTTKIIRKELKERISFPIYPWISSFTDYVCCEINVIGIEEDADQSDSVSQSTLLEFGYCTD